MGRSNRMGRSKATRLVLAMMGALLMLGPGPASAIDPGDTGKRDVGPVGDASGLGGNQSRAAVGMFEGELIDLSRDWKEARICVGTAPSEAMECFRSESAADERVESLRVGTAASTWCPSPLRIYEYSAYGGRQLQFYSRGLWQSLYYYGFDNEVSSYIVGGCWSYLAEHSYGGGAWYPGPRAPGSYVPWMWGSWTDRVSSIYMS